MSINVYWASNEKEWMLATKPESVSKKFYKLNEFNKKNALSSLNYCPAFNSSIKNLYTMKSLYTYNFTIDKTKIYTTLNDENFFNQHVLIRSVELKLFSFLNRYTFFTDSDSLETTFYQFPFLENNDITKRCIPISGKYDIGKWYRNTEFAFYLKPEFDEFKIEKDDVYGYINFHTNEKINFIQYTMNSKLTSYINEGFALNFNNSLKTLENYYKMFRLKKLILKEIKNNTL